jgi:hypothetical protein
MNKSSSLFPPVAQFVTLGTLFLALAACSNQSNTSSNAQSTGTNAVSGSNLGASGGTASALTPETPSGTSTPPTTPPTSPPATPTEPTLSDKIKTLEDNGTIPKLDRSADIKGPDQNSNGVRDDIDAWIAALSITDKQKKAAAQNAIALQKTLLVDLTDKIALQVVGDELMASTNCLSDVFMPNYQESYKLSGKIEAMTANTKARAYRYIEYNRARSGSSTLLPDGDTCK